MEQIDLVHLLRRIDGSFKRLMHLNFQNTVFPENTQFTQGHGRLLANLRRNPEGLSQKQLAENLGIRPQSLTEALDVLEKEGLIERRRSVSDRRQILVYLTEKGSENEKVARQVRHKTATELFECLDEKQQQTLYDLLEKVYENAEAIQEDGK